MGLCSKKAIFWKFALLIFASQDAGLQKLIRYTMPLEAWQQVIDCY